MNAHETQLPSVYLIANESPVASKPHKCIICNGEIHIGEKHKRMTYRENSAIDSRKNLRSIRFHIGPCRAECF